MGNYSQESSLDSDVDYPMEYERLKPGMFGGWGHEVLTVVMSCVFAVCMLAMPDLSAWAQKPDDVMCNWKAFGIMLLGLLSVMLAARSVVLIICTEFRRLFRMDMAVVNAFTTLPSPSFIIVSFVSVFLFLVAAPLLSILSIHPTIATVLTVWGTGLVLYYHQAVLTIRPWYIRYMKDVHPILLINVFKPLKLTVLGLLNFFFASLKRYVQAIQGQIMDPKFRKAVITSMSALVKSFQARWRAILPIKIQLFLLKVLGIPFAFVGKLLPLLMSLIGLLAKQSPSIHQLSKTAQYHWWRAHGLLPKKPIAILLLELFWSGWEPLREMAVFTATGSFLESEHFKLIERQYSIVYLILAALFAFTIARTFIPHLVTNRTEKKINRLFLFTVVAGVAAAVVFTSFLMGDLLVLLCHYAFGCSGYKLFVSSLATKPTPGFERNVAMKMREAPPAAFRYLGLLACLMLLVFGLLRLFRCKLITRIIVDPNDADGYSRAYSRERAPPTRKTSSSRTRAKGGTSGKKGYSGSGGSRGNTERAEGDDSEMKNSGRESHMKSSRNQRQRTSRISQTNDSEFSNPTLTNAKKVRDPDLQERAPCHRSSIKDRTDFQDYFMRDKRYSNQKDSSQCSITSSNNVHSPERPLKTASYCLNSHCGHNSSLGNYGRTPFARSPNRACRVNANHE